MVIARYRLRRRTQQQEATMTYIRWAFLVAVLFSVASCASNDAPFASGIAPLSITSNEGAPSDPTTAPRGIQSAVEEGGIPGESGFDSASSAASGQ